MTQRSPRAAHKTTKPATEAADGQGPGELPPVGRKRGANPNRMIAWLTQQGAEKDQNLAAANALIDELEEALEAEQEANAGLRAELVASTSGNAAAGT